MYNEKNIKVVNIVEEPTKWLYLGNGAVGYEYDLGGCIEEVVDAILENNLGTAENVILAEYVEPDEFDEMEDGGWTFCSGWDTEGCWLNFWYVKEVDEKELKRLEEAV